MNLLERKRTEAEILSALGGVHEDNPVLKALLGIMHEQFHQESVAALQPNLTNEARQFNAGRAAAIADLNTHVQRLWQKANQPK